jgi:hypothetical protein
MSDADQIAAARGILQTADQWLKSLEHQLEKVRAENDRAVAEAAGHAAEKAAHEKHLADLTAKHQAECAARERELQVRETHLAEASRELAGERDRVYARERDAEAKAAYLGQRLREGTAA